MTNNTGLLWYCGKGNLSTEIPRALERCVAQVKRLIEQMEVE